MSQSARINLSNVSVLCIDDDAVIRSVIRFALQRHGCRDVVQAHGGMEALDLCAGRRFDLLICDYQMAPMNGVEFLRQLAGTGLGQGSPVIMLSAETDPATIEDARALGACTWIGKPVSAQTLLAQVGNVLRLGGHIGEGVFDPEMNAMAERNHARLMAALRAAEESTRSLSVRPRDTATLARNLHGVLIDASEQARPLGYGLLALLAARAIDFVTAMERNPAAATQTSAATTRALGSLITAMQRVAHNRMIGDGGEAGLKLLTVIDGVVTPARAGLGP
jgi:two-component system chemotaxis response regulator CheY